MDVRLTKICTTINNDDLIYYVINTNGDIQGEQFTSGSFNKIDIFDKIEIDLTNRTVVVPMIELIEINKDGKYYINPAKSGVYNYQRILCDDTEYVDYQGNIVDISVACVEILNNGVSFVPKQYGAINDNYYTEFSFYRKYIGPTLFSPIYHVIKTRRNLPLS